MTKQGYHKVIGRMIYRGPMTLSEITESSKLTKPTVHHHLQNLMKQKIVVYDKTKGKYSVVIDEDLKKQILNCLRNERTFEQLREDLIKESNNERIEKSPLKLLIKDKEFGNKLNDLLEFLFEEGLVTEVVHHVLSGTKFSKEYRWTLTWKGSTRIGICHICKKEIDSKLSSAVVQTILTGTTYENDVEIFDIMLIHPKCAILSSEKYANSLIGMYSGSYDLCDYCGLPFSEERLRKQFKSYNDPSSFELLYNLLSLEEIDALSKERRLELILNFKKRYDLEPPIKLFEGEVLLKKKFNYTTYDEGVSAKDAFKNPELAHHLTFTPQKSFDFLNNPKFSDLERLGKIIEKHTKRKFDNKRLKELFEEWSKYHAKQEEKIDAMISSLLSSPMAKIYPKIWNYEPGPWDVSDDRIPDLFNSHQYLGSFGFSFVLKDEKGNCYHERCYHSLQSTKDNLIAKEVKKTK